MNDEKLREYVREEFVKSGFISVSQWKNFIDYLQILLKQEKKEGKKQALISFIKWIDERIRKFQVDLDCNEKESQVWWRYANVIAELENINLKLKGALE